MAAAPKTGFHTAPEEVRREALSKFFAPVEASAIVCTPTTGGVNNVVQYIDTPKGEKYILRIYNNGGKSEKVVFEHTILQQLSQQKLSFETPRAKLSLAGRPHELLSSGAESCIFHIIPGGLAKTTSPQEVGRATGELCTAMGKVKVDLKALPPPIPPYYDVFAVHHAIGGDKEKFYKEVATNPEFGVCREAIDFLTAEIRKMEATLEEYQKLGLPMQLIHGDLHFDNVMVLGDAVSGLLDFEFCAYDWRAMELAVALSKYVGEEDPLPLIEEFVTGFAEHGELTEQEMKIIPNLVNLRIFSNVIYFTGRAMAGEDSLESLTSRAGSYAKRIKWVNANREKFVSTLLAKMKALATVSA